MGACRVRWKGRAGGGNRLVGGAGDFFFLTKSKNYLKIILKHSFDGDCCPG